MKNVANVKTKKTTYGERLKQAYERGYSSGWTDRENNATFGASLAGSIGYGNGSRARKRFDKAQRSERYVKNIRQKAR